MRYKVNDIVGLRGISTKLVIDGISNGKYDLGVLPTYDQENTTGSRMGHLWGIAEENVS